MGTTAPPGMPTFSTILPTPKRKKTDVDVWEVDLVYFHLEPFARNRAVLWYTSVGKNTIESTPGPLMVKNGKGGFQAPAAILPLEGVAPLRSTPGQVGSSGEGANQHEQETALATNARGEAPPPP